MRSIAAMLNSACGDLDEQGHRIEQQLAEVEQILRASRHRERIVSPLCVQ
jgi:hypothetical protein